MNPQEAASTLGLFALSVLAAFLGWQQNHTMMRHGLFALCTWLGGAVSVRIVRELGYATPDQVRLFNGAFAWVVILILIATWTTQWIVERRHR